MNHRRIAARAALAVTTILLALVGVEAAVRLIDDYPFLALGLQRRPTSSAGADEERATAYMRTLDVAPGVDRTWFSVIPDRPLPPPPPDVVLAAQLPEFGTLGLPSLYEWNRQYLEALACRQPEVFAQLYGSHKQVFVFEPLNPGEFPTFRFLRRAAYPSGLITNQFGWRGPEVALQKPDRTIRVAFVGASTTAGYHGARASHPEHIGVWLNLWAKARGLGVRFEVINAAREGINSNSIAEVVRQEVLPLEPDLVVYYEGSNQFWPASFIEWPAGSMPERPRLDPRTPWPAERFSVLAVRGRSWYDAWKGSSREPKKPTLPVRWPAQLDELDPALDSPVIPLNLNVILADLETMRTSLTSSGGDLVIASFVWLVADGLQLDPRRDGSVYSYLNQTFWPFSYAHMRRMADFQNRVFAKYARTKGLDLIDLAGVYPRDPELFADAIHFKSGGTRLQSWLVLQQLIPLIERRIASGALPRPARTHLAQHPAFAQDPRRLVPVSSFGTHCAK